MHTPRAAKEIHTILSRRDSAMRAMSAGAPREDSGDDPASSG
jgi:hypothetical protein